MGRYATRLSKGQVFDGLIVLAVIGAILWVLLKPREKEVEALVGEPAPQFKLRTMSGAVVGTPDHAGKIVLLDFWATWCNPCFKQMPIIHAVLQKHPDVELLAINVDDPGSSRKKAMERFLDGAKIDADSLIDDGTVQLMYRVLTIPSLVLIAPDGTIAYASSGVHSEKALNERIERLKGKP